MPKKYMMFQRGDKGPPKSMPKHETRELIAELKEIRDTATMKNASFSEEVKGETRLWRETYIVDPLTRLIERYEDHLDRNEKQTP